MTIDQVGYCDSIRCLFFSSAINISAIIIFIMLPPVPAVKRKENVVF